MKNEYENGGVKTTDISSFNRAVKATWVTKYFNALIKASGKIFPTTAFFYAT